MENIINMKTVNSIWFEKIPNNWNFINLQYLIDFYNGYAFKSEDFVDEGASIMRISDISPTVDVEGCKKINSDKYPNIDSSKILFNDLIIAMTGATIGKNCHYLQNDLIYANQRVGIIRAKDKIKQGYLKYIVNSVELKEYIKLICSGSAQENISSSQIGEFKLPVPPIQTQVRIAEFLDQKTAEIDTIIDKKEKLLTLLEEKKKAIINEAVTKGLNLDVPMKDSGIEWIGEIPEHWKVTSFKYVSDFILDGTHGSHNRVDEGFRLLSVRNIIDDKFVFRNDDSLISEVDLNIITSKFKVETGDIILAIVGATLGKVAIVEDMTEKFATQRSIATIRIISSLNNKFFYYFMRSSSYNNFLWSETNFSAQPGIYLNTLNNSKCVQPPTNEQNEIVTFIDERIDEINKVIVKVLEQMKKLKEYRQSLISEALTGKIEI